MNVPNILILVVVFFVFAGVGFAVAKLISTVKRRIRAQTLDELQEFIEVLDQPRAWQLQQDIPYEMKRGDTTECLLGKGCVSVFFFTSTSFEDGEVHKTYLLRYLAEDWMQLDFINSTLQRVQLGGVTRFTEDDLTDQARADALTISKKVANLLELASQQQTAAQ